jgi:hypothetical protein
MCDAESLRRFNPRQALHFFTGVHTEGLAEEVFGFICLRSMGPGQIVIPDTSDPGRFVITHSGGVTSVDFTEVG